MAGWRLHHHPENKPRDRSAAGTRPVSLGAAHLISGKKTHVYTEVYDSGFADQRCICEDQNTTLNSCNVYTREN